MAHAAPNRSRKSLRTVLGSAISQRSRRHTATKGVSLRLAFTVIASFVLLPVLYLQYHLVKIPPHSHPHKIRDDLQHFQRRQSRDRSRHGSPSASSSTSLPSLGGSTPPRILTAYLEPPSTLTYKSGNMPQFSRKTTAASLTKLEFPQVGWCDPTHRVLPDLPIDEYPEDDPFLPWIHDYFVSEDARFVRFVSQNKRRCDTGEHHKDTMSFWEPQVTLFQSIPIVEVEPDRGTSTGKGPKARLASSMEEATHPATRFQCRFFRRATNETITTWSIFKFDYEYVTWRKLRRPMMDREGGKDTAMFWLSTLLFSCPVPDEWQSLLIMDDTSSLERSRSLPDLYLDLIPIRTPIREYHLLLTVNHTGPEEFAKLQSQLYPLESVFGTKQFLPFYEDAGRWANLPICPRPPEEHVRRRAMAPAAGSTTITAGIDKEGSVSTSEMSVETASKVPFQFVACTWTAASYTRRGDVIRVSDSAARLREWIVFHLMVGVEHVYIYDNTNITNSTTASQLWHVTQEFPEEQVTYHAWPCKICNNNRPAHPNPGERSSQYSAENSCRERYGPLTEWMTFIDVDEYLIPMKAVANVAAEKGLHYDWRPILDEMKAKGVPILQFLSSRARPRVDLMEDLEDQSMCKDPTGQKNNKYPNTDSCIGPKKEETFLNTYNCDYIRPPKPQRFDRARKQIYQTSYVWSHFVHYSTVTADYAETYSEFQEKHNDGSGGKFLSKASGPSWTSQYPDVFVDELATGALIHARSVMPHETRRRSAECSLGSRVACMVGYLCEDTVEFIDEKHQANVFNNSDGSYCNCWENAVVTQSLVPRLVERMQEHTTQNVVSKN